MDQNSKKKGKNDINQVPHTYNYLSFEEIYAKNRAFPLPTKKKKKY